MLKKILPIGLLISLAACTISHDIKISRPPCLYPFKNYDFTLCRTFKFKVDDTLYRVHKGFATDLASIPRALWGIYSPTKTETIPAAVIHDYLYFCPGEMTRREADSIFYDSLIVKGFPRFTAFRYWIVVRIFGSSHFNKGAFCYHGYARTTNTIGHMRMADAATSEYLSVSSQNRQRGQA